MSENLEKEIVGLIKELNEEQLQEMSEFIDDMISKRKEQQIERFRKTRLHKC